jgi:outer membrane protein assembly factor BamB
MMHNHVNRDGLFVDPLITPTTAPTFQRDTSFAGTISGNVYASPLYVENGASGKGTFYQATENGTIYALDETTGAVVWSKNVGPSAKSTGAGCGNISPIGITGTPAIDLDTRLIVFDSAVDTADAGVISTHMIYGLSIDTGAIVWSVDVSTLKDPTGLTFTPQTQNQRAAVLIVNGIAYVAYAGHYGDCGSYHGWVVGVPLSGKGAKAWATQVAGAGIWGPGGPASDGESIYVTTGNGFNSAATYAESEGIIRLDPGPTFTMAVDDYFAPYNWSMLDDDDLDLSGSGPLIIDAPSITPSTLAMAAGKDGYLYLTNRMSLGGVATMAQRANVGALQVQTGELSNAGAWATIGGTTYVVVRPNGENPAMGCPKGMSGDLVAVKLDPTAADKMTVVWCAASLGVGSPSITSPDGTTSALVWVFAADPGSRAQLFAWDLATGSPVFTGGSATTDAAQGVRRFTAPIAVHGRVFVAGDNQVFAYKAK